MMAHTKDKLSSIPRMRGKAFHRYLVDLSAKVFRRLGFEVAFEYPIKLSNGLIDYVDILAQQGDCKLICEVETTSRHVLDNLAKAGLLNIPLWIVVSSRGVRFEVINKLRSSGYKLRNASFRISMPDELQQRLTNHFPNFSSANRGRKNGKTNQSSAFCAAISRHFPSEAKITLISEEMP